VRDEGAQVCVLTRNADDGAGSGGAKGSAASGTPGIPLPADPTTRLVIVALVQTALTDAEVEAHALDVLRHGSSGDDHAPHADDQPAEQAMTVLDIRRLIWRAVALDFPLDGCGGLPTAQTALRQPQPTTPEPPPDTRQLNRVLYALEQRGEVVRGPPVGNGRSSSKPTWRAAPRT
jgi:hypothetical protein